MDADKILAELQAAEDHEIELIGLLMEASEWTDRLRAESEKILKLPLTVPWDRG